MGVLIGSWKGDTEKELKLINKNQRDYAINLFKESYDILGINYKDIDKEETNGAS